MAFTLCRTGMLHKAGILKAMYQLPYKSTWSTGFEMAMRFATCSTGNSFKTERLISHQRSGFRFYTPVTGNMAKDSESQDSTVKQTVKEQREFQADTRMLLDIVAKSLYSESEIFIRELISNSSDALEKLRFMSMANEDLETPHPVLEILLHTDKTARTFTIQDTGVGMTKEEMIQNLGTIAQSGSKALLEQLKKEGGGGNVPSIIGQFGVGFYSAFMVANKVEVYSKSRIAGSKPFKWSSDGETYDVEEIEAAAPGTKIVVYLKPDCRQFADEETVRGIVKRYSNFVGSPIFLNGTQINRVEALWLKDPREVDAQMHEEFYRFISSSVDRPRFVLHFSTDVPLSLRCLVYVPESKPGLFELSREGKLGVSLYSRKVLIKDKADNIVPQWLRFLKGVLDSEDIPLNLSRELLQEGALIRKLRTVFTNRLLRFLTERAQKEPDSYAHFYKDYGIFLKEGIIIENEQLHKEEISKLLRFESSNLPSGQLTSLPDYLSRMQAAQKDVYYLAAPSRELAERSPYLEAMCEKVEVLFCFEAYDEMVLLQLQQFGGKPLTSVEKEMRKTKDDLDLNTLPIGSMSKSDAESLSLWLQQILKGRAHAVKLTKNLESHPCVVTVEEMAAARHFIRTQSSQMSSEARWSILQPRFEINIKHPIIKKLSVLKDSDPDLAVLLAEQLFAISMVTAGLEDDPRKMIIGLNELLTKTLEKC